MNDQTHLGRKVCFTIYTEERDIEAIRYAVSREFEAATFFVGDGFWKGDIEKAVAIQIIGHESQRGAVHAVAHEIKRVNEQEAVLITAVVLEESISI